MHRTLRTKHMGFTLLELMIAIALMLIVMLMLRTMFVTAQEMYVRASRRVDVYSQARAALDILEQDMMRMRGEGPDTVLGLASRKPAEMERFQDNRVGPYYSDLTDWEAPDPNQTTKIRDIVTFGGTATWYDPDLSAYVTGDAVISYYLRRRIPVEGIAPEGAYLVRRVMPVYSLAELSRMRTQKPSYALRVTEEELAGFVYYARVYADDQAAFQLGALNRQFNLDTMPEATLEARPNSAWTWVRTPLAGPIQPVQPPAPGQTVVVLPKPTADQRVEFGGDWKGAAAAPDRDFVAARGNYPAVVVVDLCMIDRSFERMSAREGSGTYRSFSRAIQVPVSGPMNRLDDVDKDILAGR